MEIKQGIYIGKGNVHEDTPHGGIKMLSQKYFFIFFDNHHVYKKGVWIYLDKPINIESYISDFKKNIAQNASNFRKGNYSIEGNILEIELISNSQVYKEIYSILSPEILLDENLNEYNYLGLTC